MNSIECENKIILNNKCIQYNYKIINDENNRINPNKYFINALLKSIQERLLENEELKRKILMNIISKYEIDGINKIQNEINNSFYETISILQLGNFDDDIDDTE